MSKFKIVSLFSGAGGLDLGFEFTGKYSIILANDVKDFMVKTYSTNFKVKKTGTILSDTFPQVVLCDVCDLDFNQLKHLDVDVVIGGPPCQDFSVLRASTTDRFGITVKRGRLYAHFIRALVQLQPRAFVFENVPGLVSANKGLAYKTIIEDFNNLNLRWGDIKRHAGLKNNGERKNVGYHLVFNEVVNASSFGVPQLRRRLIIVGIRKDLLTNNNLFDLQYLFKRKMKHNCELIGEYPLTPLEVFEGKPLPSLQKEYEEVMKKYEKLWDRVKSTRAFEWKRKEWDRLSFDIVRDYLTLNKIPSYRQEDAFNQHKEILKELGYLGVNISSLKFYDGSDKPPDEPPEIKEKLKMIPPGENFKFVVNTPWELRKKGVSQIYRRLHPLKPSYTIVAYGGGGMAVYHYERTRSALTSREKARLQTFPDSYTFVGSYSAMKAEIGEAVPPLLAKRIAEALAWLLNELG